MGYTDRAARAETAILEALSRAGADRVELSRTSGDASRGKERDDGLGESIVQQEESCGAMQDVVTARFFSGLEGEALMSRLAAVVADPDTMGASGAGVRVLDAKFLTKSSQLNAEASCTQRVYSYLVPFWAINTRGCEPHVEATWSTAAPGTVVRPEPPDPEMRRALAVLKATVQTVMRSLDGAGVHKEEVEEAEEDGEAPAADRVQHFAGMRLYGSASRRRFRWHNFAAPELAGGLSPRKEAVRCALDKIVHAETVLLRGELFLAVAMFGDHFLTQQCRRIVGALLCVHHGWLPPDFFRTATRAEVVVSTPAAPGHLLYVQKCLFATWSRRHGRLFDRGWAERVRRGGTLVPDAPDFEAQGGVPKAAMCEWRRELHAHIESEEFGEGAGPGGRFAAWMYDLEHRVAPRIRGELEVVAQVDAFAAGHWEAPRAEPALPGGEGCPEAYREVLHMLRGLVAEGRWPTTSPARAQVLRAGGGGSFSVGGPGAPARWAPRGSTAFPELTAAVFALEAAISPPGRAPSTMVAINHNALFAPHTDSGAGLGQSRSLIVGLGSYAGGELVVEGQVSGIRYQPLEFDGWRQRHWTLPFAGERFSLVWFTPA